MAISVSEAGVTDTEKRDMLVALAERVMCWRRITEAEWDIAQPGLFLWDASIQRAYFTDGAGGHGWNPLESIADSWMLVEAMRQKWMLGLLDIDGMWKVQLHGRDGNRMTGDRIDSADESVCLAICRAALKAVSK
jgi:hypothetical protein